MKKFLKKALDSVKFISHHNAKNIYLFNVQNSLYVFILKLVGFKLRYFNGFYSENGQDIIILNYFSKNIQNAESRLFVDVGANHPIKYNNSYFFEKYLDFSTIAVEPLSKYKALWEEMRTKAEFHNTAISPTRDMITFTVFDGENNEDMFSGISVSAGKLQGKSTTISVPSVPLSELVGSRSSEFSILSIDVEGAELDVLSTIDFEEFTPTIILVENNEGLWGNEEVRKFIMSKGYIYFGRIWSLDDIFHKTNTSAAVGLLI